jgi:YHS domain-containing protein
MQTKRTYTAAALLIAVAVFLQSGIAKDRVEPVFTHSGATAIRGYDTVAYFKDGKPVKGTPQFSTQWMGATWQFANASNRDAFQQAPEKYAPQFGGYCAWAVGHNYTASTDPEAWKVVDGKLYLNNSKSVQKMWEQDQARWIMEADRNWPGLHK